MNTTLSESCPRTNLVSEKLAIQDEKGIFKPNKPIMWNASACCRSWESIEKISAEILDKLNQ